MERPPSEPYSHDDELIRFAADGAPPLPAASSEGYVDHEGARIWYAVFGQGAPVFLLHGGLGHGGNWSYQVPALIAAGYSPVLIDSRGHGRSTRDGRRYTYELMASDVFAVMDTLGIESAALVGWSDGACIALIMGMQAPERVNGVFFFACNMDPSGTNVESASSPVLDRCFARHAQDYAQLSSTPDDFRDFVSAVVQMMQTEPNYTAAELSEVRVPVAIVQGDGEQFIKREHSEYLAATIPDAELIILPGVSHFAPLQRPEVFNSAMLSFLDGVLPEERVGSDSGAKA
jgi:pimeloyl-ACP methyl ester carboxylesterase